jgi:peroxisomal coenzyme A diphosphatase NUDT7
MDDSRIPRPFRIEPLCHLPCSLAKTELAVRPCVAFLHADDQPGRAPLLVDETLIPRLDAKEVAAVFSAPLHNFLLAEDELPTEMGPLEGGEKDGSAGAKETARFQHPPLPDGHWYDGRWTEWQGVSWRVHNFWVPINNQRVTRPPPPPPATDLSSKKQSLELDDEDESPQRFLVWGLTGRMLVDTARVAYDEEPEFEHNTHYGDEGIIARLEVDGRLPEKERRRAAREVGQAAVKDDVKDAKM